MSLFNINWRALLSDWLPPSKRFENVVDLLESLVVGLATLSASFVAFESKSNIEVLVTSQVAVLRAYLEYKFSLSGVVIETNQAKKSQLSFYQSQENIPVFFKTEAEQSQTFVFTSPEIVSTFDYFVRVPALTTQLATEIRSELVKYSLASKTFDIVAL